MIKDIIIHILKRFSCPTTRHSFPRPQPQHRKLSRAAVSSSPPFFSPDSATAHVRTAA